MFNQNIGIERKAARLRYFGSLGAPLEGESEVQNPAQRGPGASWDRIPGVQRSDPAKIHDALWSKYNILTAMMGHEEYSGLRVTPHVYSTVRDVDYFAEMVEKEVKSV